MEKRITFVQFQSVKSVAKAIDPLLRQQARIQSQYDGLDEEFTVKEAQAIEKLKARMAADLEAKKQSLKEELEAKTSEIDAFEAGIVHNIGFHVTDLVKKVVETDANGNKVTKYLPTNIVTYDNESKQYIINAPDNSEETAATATTSIFD